MAADGVTSPQLSRRTALVLSIQLPGLVTAANEIESQAKEYGQIMNSLQRLPTFQKKRENHRKGLGKTTC